jgi:hypothetical protein
MSTVCGVCVYRCLLRGGRSTTWHVATAHTHSARTLHCIRALFSAESHTIPALSTRTLALQSCTLSHCVACALCVVQARGTSDEQQVRLFGTRLSVTALEVWLRRGEGKAPPPLDALPPLKKSSVGPIALGASTSFYLPVDLDKGMGARKDMRRTASMGSLPRASGKQSGGQIGDFGEQDGGRGRPIKMLHAAPHGLPRAVPDAAEAQLDTSASKQQKPTASTPVPRKLVPALERLAESIANAAHVSELLEAQASSQRLTQCTHIHSTYTAKTSDRHKTAFGASVSPH